MKKKVLNKEEFLALCIFLLVALIGVATDSSAEAIPGGTLDPTLIAKYVSPLVIPPAMPSKSKTGYLDYYEIAVRQFQQQILPESFPKTTVWSYGPAKESIGDNEGKHAMQGGHYFYPAFTIEAKYNKPVRVKWINELKRANGQYRPHLLPVDQTLHWANPPGGEMERDMRPMFMETPGLYTGPVPIVTHLHGAVGVGDESDGYPEAWFLPAAKNIPAGYAKNGTWYDFFKAKSLLKFWQPWERGSAVFQYPNRQRAATLWYHDHTLGMTRTNVYAGPAGFYLVRGGPEDLDLRYNPPGNTLGKGVNPSKIITEIPLAIQDRSFNGDGSLFYPNNREFFGDIPPGGPFLPVSDIAPNWNPEFFGNTIVVNGQTWPYLTVEKRRYRFRVLNGCNSRFLILKFDDPNVKVWQIGTEGGFLPVPLDINTFPAPNKGLILLGLAERADLIVDFTDVPGGTNFKLINLGPDEPFGGGTPGIDFSSSDPGTTGQVMEFRVVAAKSKDETVSPEKLTLPAIQKLTGGTIKPLALIEEMSMFPGFDAPAEAKLGTMSGGIPIPRMWMSSVTENPVVGEKQVWEFYNFTADAHPIHIHEVHFQVVNRQALQIDQTSGEVIIPVIPDSAPRVPEPWELGSFKDTVIAYPGEVTRVRAKFSNPGLFVWHCHIIEHEDNEMMRPFFIGNNVVKLPYNFYIKSLGRDLF